MNEIAVFFAQCAHSKAILDSLCALVVIPPAAWVVSRLLATQILRMVDDPAWQAPYAAVAASLPGALFLVLSVFALVLGRSTTCWTMPGGRIVFTAIALVAVLAIVRAVCLAIARGSDLRRLVRLSNPASLRLRELASSGGLRAREVRDDTPVCALVGVLAPIVLVSSGALRALRDEELRAALLHEQAHTRHGDQIIALCLAFFADLLPLPAGDLIETYKLARELSADRSAAQTAGNDALASALIRFAKTGRALAGATGFSGSAQSNVVSRLAALLEDRRECYRTPKLIRRLAVGLALVTIVVAAIAMPASAAQRPGSCSIQVSGNP